MDQEPYKAYFLNSECGFDFDVVEDLFDRVAKLCMRLDDPPRFTVLYPQNTLEEAKSLKTFFVNFGDEVFPREYIVGYFKYKEKNNDVVEGFGVMGMLPIDSIMSFSQWVKQWANKSEQERAKAYVTGPDAQNIDFCPEIKKVLRSIKKGAEKIHTHGRCNSFLLESIRISADHNVTIIPYLEEGTLASYKGEVECFDYIVQSITYALNQIVPENVLIFHKLVQKVLSAEFDGVDWFRWYNFFIFKTALVWDFAERESFAVGAGDAYHQLKLYKFDLQEANFNDWQVCLPIGCEFEAVYVYIGPGGVVNPAYAMPCGIIKFRRNVGEHTPKLTRRQVEERFFFHWPKFCSVIQYQIITEYMKSKSISQRQLDLIMLN